MDTYSLVNEAGAVHYGGVADWSVQDGEQRLSLTDEAATALGVEDGYRIALAGSAAVKARMIEDELGRLVGASARQGDDS
jgi:hypothetical protein